MICLALVVSLWWTMLSEQPPMLIVSNPTPHDRLEEPVVLSRAELVGRLGSLEDSVPVLYDASGGTLIPSQTDDLDGDGRWDELAFLVDVPANGARRLLIKAEDRHPTVRYRTNAHLGVSRNRDGTFVAVAEELRPRDHEPQSQPPLYQMEGPVWENDLVGFRSYFDRRNGKDIFGKVTTDMVLDTVGIRGNYHELSEWGLDILKVGGSLGVGGLGFFRNGAVERLGETEEARYRLIAEGPCRTIVELSYAGPQLRETGGRLTERITIWAGRYGFQSEILVPGASVDLVVGLPTLTADSLYHAALSPRKSVIVAEGSIIPADPGSKLRSIGEALYMAVLYETEREKGYARTHSTGDGSFHDPVTDTWYVRLGLTPGAPNRHWVFAYWDTRLPAGPRSEFIRMLTREAEQLESPLSTHFE